MIYMYIHMVSVHCHNNSLIYMVNNESSTSSCRFPLIKDQKSASTHHLSLSTLPIPR